MRLCTLGILIGLRGRLCPGGSNGLYPLNYLKADLAYTPKLTTSAMAICLPLSEGAIKWQEQTIRQLKPRIHLNQLFSWNDDIYLGEF